MCVVLLCIGSVTPYFHASSVPRRKREHLTSHALSRVSYLLQDLMTPGNGAGWLGAVQQMAFLPRLPLSCEAAKHISIASPASVSSVSTVPAYTNPFPSFSPLLCQLYLLLLSPIRPGSPTHPAFLTIRIQDPDMIYLPSGNSGREVVEVLAVCLMIFS